jgi:hypothetical protein
MWDAYRLPAIGNFSVRKIALSLLAVIITAFLWTITFSPITHAADATWQGNDIVVDGNTYKSESNPIPGLPAGSQAYSFQQPEQGVAHVLYFPANSDSAKPISAQIQDFKIQNGQYSDPSPPTAINLAAKGDSANGQNGEEKKEKTQCDVPGVGWIICTVSRYIATGMDNIFQWISGYLEVKPVTTDTDSGLYKAWTMMLGLANAAFVVAFLIMIYSQITGYGMSNYNLKKMIPRLIVAAVAVNISYFICGIAVDASNIFGHSLQQALVDMRNSLSPAVPEASGWLTWKNLTEYILSGGTIAGAGIVGYTALVGGTVGGSISGLVFLLFPILITGALAVLVALIVLAARQALITVLIVVSPLAFVAYLLPNTEKWFEKWRELFTTMLMVFPLFSLLFGGSQLASHIIIQNADQASIVIFAMFIQVAPLVITPFLVRFSGSLLGRLAGMVNDPKKGVVDRARNWANDRTELRRNAGYSAAAQGRGTFLQRSAWKRETNKRNRDGLKNMYEAEADAGWHNDERYHAIHKRNKFAEMRKSVGESSGDVEFEREKASNPTYQAYSGRQRLNQDVIKTYQREEDRAFEEAKTSDRQKIAGNRFIGLSDDARDVQRRMDVADSANAAAKAIQREEYGRALINSEDLQIAAGGVAGADRALAAGISEYRKAYGDHVDEASAILKHYNLSGSQRQAHALGETITVSDGHGGLKMLRADSIYTREAAIEAQLKTGTVMEINQIVEASGDSLRNYATTIGHALAENKVNQKAVFLGGQTINDVGQAKVKGVEGLNAAILRTIMDGKISSGDLAMNDAEALKRIFGVAQNIDTQIRSGQTPEGLDAAKFLQRVESLKKAANTALENRSISGSIKEAARDVLVDMRATLPGDLGNPEPGATGQNEPPASGNTGNE